MKINIVEYFKERTLFDWCFLLIGIITQFAAYIITHDTLLSLTSGVTGIFAVVLCSQRKISYYLFAVIQMITYMILCWQQHLYGEFVENIFYAITMIIGVIIWANHYDTGKVDSKSFTLSSWIIVSLITILCIIGLGGYLQFYTDDTQPWLDSITTIPAFVAQILMMLRYKEQWIFWLIIDVGSIVMWGIADNMCMMMQYIFWTANCIYGYVLWNKM